MSALSKSAPAQSGPDPVEGLRVWALSFNLALDLMPLCRRLEGGPEIALARRLRECTSRLPASMASARNSGSRSQFIRNLHDGLSDVGEIESHMFLCAEMGVLEPNRYARLLSRTHEIRRSARALILRMRPDASLRDEMVSSGRERGSALVIALVVSALLGAIGLTFLQIADAESRIAARARDRDALLNIAESGARAVKAWFDQPVSGDPSDPSLVRHAFLGQFDLREPAVYDRLRRMIDHDGDPATSLVQANGSAGREFYGDGQVAWPGSSALRFISAPYRGPLPQALSGPEAGPDLVIEDRPGAVDLLDRINDAIFPDQARTGRIERIEIFGPPASATGSVVTRLGIASVKVTSALYPRLLRDGGIPVVPPGVSASGRAVVRMGLAAIPLTAPRGPFESCRDLVATGRMRAAWGRVIALGDVVLPDTMDRLDYLVASAFPYASFTRRISGLSAGGDLADWLASPDTTVEDPWLKIVAGGRLIGWQTLPDQPFPFRQGRRIDLDHSNLFQRVSGLTCPAFDYSLWKAIVLSSAPAHRHLRYFAFDPATGLFREGGAGPSRSVRDWTHGEDGLFFFDTRDGAPPTSGNLTPPVFIAGGDWSTAGLIYLNASQFEAGAARGVVRVIQPPGEPFDDEDRNLTHDATENFVNLLYATAVTGSGPAASMQKMVAAAQSARAESPDREAYEATTSMRRDRRGIPLLGEVNLFGVLYNSGTIVAEGDSVTYGSLVAGGGVIQNSPGADTPIIWFDERLNTGEWPPPEIHMPRTWVTWWQTSRP